jgi:A nuclease of the HNH/ENDO VII superfamily with conserved WHH
VVPPEVKRLPSGRYPANFAYAGQRYDGPGWTPRLADKYPEGVRFTADGFPDFSPYAIATVTFDPNFLGNYTSDFTEATRKAGLETMLDGYTWHHHQDARTMQLVPIELHDAVRHAGGVSIMKGRE